jgi:hypothetical protein
MASVGPLGDEHTLIMLMERLNWPVRMVRWLAAREMARLLSDKTYHRKAKRAYLDWLASRQFESEVISGLAVLLCLEESDVPAFSDIRASVNKPSILADEIIQLVYGIGQIIGGWTNAHSGPAPAAFIIEKYFDDHKQSQVPAILCNDLEDLEARSGLPFIRQWAYEWQQLMKATRGPYSGFPYHFIGENLRQSGIFAQLSQPQCNVFRSAYLRTLAFAVSEWRIPLRAAVPVANNCLPLNRGLVRVRPVERPEWLKDIPERCCEEGASLELTREITRAAGTASGIRPVKLEIPIKSSLFEFGDLSVSAVFATDDFEPDPEDSWYFRQMTGWILPDSISFAGQMRRLDPSAFTTQGMKGSCLPVCVGVWPLPSGFWHNDWLATGLALPASYNFETSPEAMCSDDGIIVRCEGATVGAFSMWHDEWTPMYAKDGNTRCGLVTLMHQADLDRAEILHAKKLGWVAELRLWSRAKDYGEYELHTRRRFFRDV